MTPDKLAEYISSVGLILTMLFWFNMFIAAMCGAFDKDISSTEAEEEEE